MPDHDFTIHHLFTGEILVLCRNVSLDSLLAVGDFLLPTIRIVSWSRLILFLALSTHSFSIRSSSFATVGESL